MATGTAFATSLTPIQISTGSGGLVLRTGAEVVVLGDVNVTPGTGLPLPPHTEIALPPVTDTLYACSGSPSEITILQSS